MAGLTDEQRAALTDDVTEAKSLLTQCRVIKDQVYALNGQGVEGSNLKARFVGVAQLLAANEAIMDRVIKDADAALVVPGPVEDTPADENTPVE